MEMIVYGFTSKLSALQVPFPPPPTSLSFLERLFL